MKDKNKVELSQGLSNGDNVTGNVIRAGMTQAMADKELLMLISVRETSNYPTSKKKFKNATTWARDWDQLFIETKCHHQHVYEATALVAY